MFNKNFLCIESYVLSAVAVSDRHLFCVQTQNKFVAANRVRRYGGLYQQLLYHLKNYTSKQKCQKQVYNYKSLFLTFCFNSMYH